MKFEFLAVVTMNITVFWGVTACSLVSEECAASIFRIEEALMVKAVCCCSETLVPHWCHIPQDRLGSGSKLGLIIR